MPRNFSDSLPGLLPPNSTKLERDALSIVPFDAILSPAAEELEKGGLRVTASPFDPSFFGELPLGTTPALSFAIAHLVPSAIPWLEIELGTDKYKDFISDPSARIASGLTLQQMIGTPAAIEFAMGWLGVSAEVVEEQEPTIHFPEYQLRITAIPEDVEEVLCRMARLARMAQPVRSRLRRVIFGEDRPRLVLDETNQFGDLLDDYPGVDLDSVSPCSTPTGLRVSLREGVIEYFSSPISESGGLLETITVTNLEAGFFEFLLTEDGFRLVDEDDDPLTLES